MSSVERVVWSVLRARGLGGFKFRRQVPIGPFIVDFLCVEHRLIVEIDGESHGERLDYDRGRDNYLSHQGYRIVRIQNDDVLNNLEGAMRHLLGILRNEHPLT